MLLRGVPAAASSRMRQAIEQQQQQQLGGIATGQPSLVASQYIHVKERRVASVHVKLQRHNDEEDAGRREDSRRKRTAVLMRALSAAERAHQTTIAKLQRSLWWQNRICSQTLRMQEKSGSSGDWQVRAEEPFSCFVAAVYLLPIYLLEPC